MWLPLVSKAAAKSHVFSQSNILVHTQYQLVVYYGQPTMSLGSGMKCGALSSNLLLQHIWPPWCRTNTCFSDHQWKCAGHNGHAGRAYGPAEEQSTAEFPTSYDKTIYSSLTETYSLHRPRSVSHMRAHTHAHKKMQLSQSAQRVMCQQRYMQVQPFPFHINEREG